MIDEKAKRKPGFVPDAASEGIQLADGQVWYFAKPVVEFFPSFVDGRATFGATATFGADFDAKVKALDDATRAAEYYPALFTLAMDLLGRNYDLTESDHATILRFRAGDPASTEAESAIFSVALGVAPKPKPAPSESAPSS